MSQPHVWGTKKDGTPKKKTGPVKGKKWTKHLNYDATIKLVQDRIDKERIAVLDLDDPWAARRLFGYCAVLIGLANGSRIGESYDATVAWIKGRSYLSTRGNLTVDVRVEKLKPLCAYKLDNGKTCNHRKAQTPKSAGHELIVRDKKTGKAIMEWETVGMSYSMPVIKEYGRCKTKGCGCRKFVHDIEGDEKKEMTIPSFLTDDDRDKLIHMEFARKVIKWKTKGYSLKALTEFVKRSLNFNTHATRYPALTAAAKSGISPALVAKRIHMKNLNVFLGYMDEEEANALGEDFAAKIKQRDKS